MEPHGYSGVTGHFYVVPLNAFTREAGPLLDAVDHPYEDGMLDMRWWSVHEVEAAHRQSVLFAPHAFPRLMRDLLEPDRYETNETFTPDPGTMKAVRLKSMAESVNSVRPLPNVGRILSAPAPRALLQHAFVTLCRSKTFR